MPKFSPLQLEDYVRERAPEIAKDIRGAADKAQNEADLVAEVEKLLDRFAHSFDIQLNLQRERTLINGRADAVYNRFVIEYEPPRSLTKINTARTNKHAIQQVKDYMEGLERLDRHRKERLAGVVLDGDFYIFVRYREDRWFIDDPLPVNPHSTETFLRYLLSLSTEKALTPENLVRDFGENSNVARKVVPVLYQVVCCTDNPKVKTIFNQWKHQFQEITGYDPSSGQLDTADLARLYAVKEKNPDLEKLFFAIHSYYAAFIKLLAVQVVHYYLMPKTGSGLKAAADYDSEKLRVFMQKMEAGGLFKELGIRNFLEGDFFGWYLDAWDDDTHAAMARLVGELADYSLVTLDVDPEETRDLLKQLYQNLMPKKLRHALGEYYTPDWLAERLLNQLGYDGNPATRILDPACGSGTFPVLEIKRARQYVDDKMLPPGKALEQILENIVGFDLNPLAVISARANYLLALGDLLAYRRGEITIPIYLADSILTPSLGTDLFSKDVYSFSTSVGRFSIPKSLVEAHLIDRLADLLDECVHNQAKADIFRARLLRELPLKDPEDGFEIDVTVSLYERLLELEQKGINGIWARIIKNAFAPLFQPQFDYIAGNPPWVNWESLPTDYRQETKPLWEYHGLFPHGGIDTILGKGKKDLSMLMTYVAIYDYLRRQGRLGFVITQSVFKSIGAGEGFRRFLLSDGTPISVISVDDMSEIKPFEGASNRTAIIILEKDRRTIYPLRSYSLWYKKFGGTTIPEITTLSEIQEIASYRQHIAQPIDDLNASSPWITGKEKPIHAIKKIRGASEYQAHAGVYSGGANGVYWVEVINILKDGLALVSNISDGAKREVDNIQATIETELLYPLLRARDVDKWHSEPSAYILMVQDPLSRTGIPESTLSVMYPKAYAYLKNFEKVLAKRQSQAVRRLADNGAFYSMFAVGSYSFAPYKVLWERIASQIKASVVSSYQGKTIIPQETITFVGSKDLETAHFICSIANSTPFNFAVQSYSMKGGKSFGTPSILDNIRIPKFNGNNPTHRRLSELSIVAHQCKNQETDQDIAEIEAEIDQEAAHIWGLTDQELKEIQESMKELNE